MRSIRQRAPHRGVTTLERGHDHPMRQWRRPEAGRFGRARSFRTTPLTSSSACLLRC